MVKQIVNAKSIIRPDGKEYMLKEDENSTERVGTLADWVVIFINSLTSFRGRLTMLDGYKANEVLKACSDVKNEDKDTIDIKEDAYDWMMKIFFDDSEGKRITKNQNNESTFDGAFAVNVFGFMAVDMKRALEDIKEDDDK